MSASHASPPHTPLQDLGFQVAPGYLSACTSGVPGDSEVLCVAGDFASLAHPFEQLEKRGVRVRYAPLHELAAAS